MIQESSTQDLANECLQFVTRFFEAISTSAPHIYHSALFLSPKESILWTLYGQQISPLARAIQGVPTSWDPSIASKGFPDDICTAIWSPCNRFIAVTYEWSSKAVVLDAATLEQLYTLDTPSRGCTIKHLAFSPNSCLLTGYSYSKDCIVTWDLQTGGVITNINTTGYCLSISYAECGAVLGSLFNRDTVTIYNVLSGTHIFSHSVPGLAVETIWSHGEYFQFAAVYPGTIVIWEVGTVSPYAPTKISSLVIPDNFSSNDLILSINLSQLACINEGKVLVWDAQDRKVLLDSTEVNKPQKISFSLDGCFFVCGSRNTEFYIWKKSSDGYLSHKKLTANGSQVTPVVSPNGQSIVSFCDRILQLWHTTSSTTSLPKASLQVGQQDPDDFFFEISPDGSLVAATQKASYIITILDVKSGNPWLVIEMDTMICGMRITENKVFVVGDGKVIAWDLPERGCILDARRTVNNSIQTVAFKHVHPINRLYASISPDLNHLTIGSYSNQNTLCVYDMNTGEKLVTLNPEGYLPGFTPAGHEIWCVDHDGYVEWWEIIKENETNAIRLESFDKKEQLGLPFISSHGYQVTSNGWICSSSGKRLLWLPKHWLPGNDYILWHNKLLAMWNSSLLEPIILELEV